MEESKYVKFTREDLVIALEELYLKNTGRKINIGFDNDLGGLRNVKEINVRVVAYDRNDDKGEIGTIPSTGIHYNDMIGESINVSNTNYYNPPSINSIHKQPLKP